MLRHIDEKLFKDWSQSISTYKYISEVDFVGFVFAVIFKLFMVFLFVLV